MNTPNIRFKGYTDAWEQRKLGDIVSFSKGTGYSKSDLQAEGTPIILYGRLYTKYETVISDVDTFAEEKPNSVFSKGREVIVPSSGETAEDISVASVVEQEGVLLGGDLNIIMPPPYLNSAFLALNISNGKPHNDMAKMAQGKSVVHLHNSDLAKIDLPYPSYKEQCKISSYFAKLDDLISLHQRKYDDLLKVKKYMLQKLFPQNGAKIPEIRFDGFTGKWNKKRLSEVLNIITNKNGDRFGKEHVLSVSDEYGCINQIKFQGRSFAGEDISNYKIVETGNIIYTRSPLKLKPYGIIKIVGEETGIVSPLYIVNEPQEGYDSQFIYRLFDSPEKTNSYLAPLVRKGAKNTMNISNEEWLSGEIMVAPSFEEQHKIGEYFTKLEKIIEVQQHNCDDLKAVKKYMLQNMFLGEGR